MGRLIAAHAFWCLVCLGLAIGMLIGGSPGYALLNLAASAVRLHCWSKIGPGWTPWAR